MVPSLRTSTVTVPPITSWRSVKAAEYAIRGDRIHGHSDGFKIGPLLSQAPVPHQPSLSARHTSPGMQRAGDFSLEKPADLPRPMLIFHEYNRHICIWDMVRLEPAVDQPFTDKAKDALAVCVVIRDIQPLFQLKQNGKQPFAVRVKAGLLHDEHVEMVTACPGHPPVIRRNVLRI